MDTDDYDDDIDEFLTPIILKGYYKSLLDVPLKNLFKEGVIVRHIYLKDWRDGKYRTCIIEYHDFANTYYEHNNSMVVLTKGNVREAIEKGSVGGNIIEAYNDHHNNVGNSVYTVWYT